MKNASKLLKMKKKKKRKTKTYPLDVPIIPLGFFFCGYWWYGCFFFFISMLFYYAVAVFDFFFGCAFQTSSAITSICFMSWTPVCILESKTNRGFHWCQEAISWGKPRMVREQQTKEQGEVGRGGGGGGETRTQRQRDTEG